MLITNEKKIKNEKMIITPLIPKLLIINEKKIKTKILNLKLKMKKKLILFS